MCHPSLKVARSVPVQNVLYMPSVVHSSQATQCTVDPERFYATNVASQDHSVHTGLPTKDETSETIERIYLVRFLAFRAPCRPKLALFCA